MTYYKEENYAYVDVWLESTMKKVHVGVGVSKNTPTLKSIYDCGK